MIEQAAFYGILATIAKAAAWVIFARAERVLAWTGVQLKTARNNDDRIFPKERQVLIMLMIREKGFYKRLLMLAAPLALQSVISFSVGLADNIMVGSLGEKALSDVYVAKDRKSVV